MGRAITRRHSSLFQRGLRTPFQFLQDIYQYGKVRELCSFAVWELRHRLGLFPARQYLTILGDDPPYLTGAASSNGPLKHDLSRLSQRLGFSVSRSHIPWKRLFIKKEMLYGSLQKDAYSLYSCKAEGDSPTLLHTFPERIKSLFVNRQNTIFVCVKGAVYRSADGGHTFEKRLDLGSGESYFRHNNAMTETPDGTLIIGEYGNVWNRTRWKVLAFLYFSTDDGQTWTRSEFLVHQGINKHVHVVKYSNLLNQLFVADGDNKKKLWISAPLNTRDWQARNDWSVVNRFHIQMGGYTSVVETDEEIIFGTDYQGGTNFLVSTHDGRTYTKHIVPDPYRRSPIDNMVQRCAQSGQEIWANLPYCNKKTKSLLMCSTDGGKQWWKVLEYNWSTHRVSLVSSSTSMTRDIYISVQNVKQDETTVYRISDS